MDRIFIGIFGRCNAGKSTLFNLLTGGETAIVSPEAGTTTDTVRKAGELQGVGPVVWLDTAGIDDHSPLGASRIARTREAMAQVDVAVIVYREWGAPEELLVKELAGVPTVRVRNTERGEHAAEQGSPEHRERTTRRWGAAACREGSLRSPCPSHEPPLPVIPNAAGGGIWSQPDSSLTLRNDNLDELFDAIKRAIPRDETPRMLEGIGAADTVILVAPIDRAAPEGRIILPQQQAVRELLDAHAVAVVVQPEELAGVLEVITPRLIIADSQVLSFAKKAAGNVEVTSFSILLAAAKGDKELYERGLLKVADLKDGDKILIAESCTHQASCDDIGRVKIPRWLMEYTGKKLTFTTVSGLTPLPADLGDYALAVQCGGCMITRRQLLSRLRRITAAGVPVTNYGMLIDKINGI